LNTVQLTVVQLIVVLNRSYDVDDADWLKTVTSHVLVKKYSARWSFAIEVYDAGSELLNFG